MIPFVLLSYFSSFSILGIKFGYILRAIILLTLLFYSAKHCLRLRKLDVQLSLVLIIASIPSLRYLFVEEWLTYVFNITVIIFFSAYVKKNLKTSVKHFIVVITFLHVIILLGFVPESGIKYSLEVFLINANMYSGFLERPHITGFVSSYVVVAALECFKVDSSSLKNKLIYVLVLIVNIYVIYLTFARTAWLMLVLILLKELYTQRRNIVSWVVGLSLILGSYFILDFSSVIMRLSEKTLHNSSGNLTGNGRLNFWKGYLEIFYEMSWINKLFGVSPSQAQTYLVNSYSLNYEAHNFFITQLVGYGLVGLILYLLLFVRFKMNQGFTSLLLFFWLFFQGTMGLEVFVTHILITFFLYESKKPAFSDDFKY